MPWNRAIKALVQQTEVGGLFFVVLVLGGVAATARRALTHLSLLLVWASSVPRPRLLTTLDLDARICGGVRVGVGGAGASHQNQPGEGQGELWTR